MHDPKNLKETSVFECRIAKPKDLESVASLCRRAVGRDDYVLSGLARTIRQGGLFLTFSKDGEELIGMSNFTPMIDYSGWLGMARTDPAWRGRGVAQSLQRCIANFSRRLGIRTLRFFVSSTNSPSLRAARKGGFREVAECSHVTVSLGRHSTQAKGSSKLTRVPIHARTGMARTEYLIKMNSYLRYGYGFVKTSNEVLNRIVSNRQLFESNDSRFVLVMTGARVGEFALLSGKTRVALLSVMDKAQEMKIESLGGFLPYDRGMLRTARSLGFRQDEWGKHAILFEKLV